MYSQYTSSDKRYEQFSAVLFVFADDIRAVNSLRDIIVEDDIRETATSGYPGVWFVIQKDLDCLQILTGLLNLELSLLLGIRSMD